MKNKKQIIKVELVGMSRYDLEGPLDDAIETLQKLREQYKDVGELSLDMTLDYRYGDGEPCILIQLMGKREETEEEFRKRINTIDMYTQRRRLEYEALKKEFDGQL